MDASGAELADASGSGIGMYEDPDFPASETSLYMNPDAKPAYHADGIV